MTKINIDMAEEEKKEISIVVSSCTEKTWSDGTKSFEIKCTLDGNDETFYCKDELGTGPMKVTRYGDKKTIYKIKQGGGGQGNFQQKARDYTIENRQKGLDAAIAFGQGRNWDAHTVCSLAALFADFYKTGAIPPAKGN